MAAMDETAGRFEADGQEHPSQDALARWLGVPTRQRSAIVQEMFKRHSLDTVSYWLQLVLATGIATLGLVLSSTGIVIGAMPISPLMSPLVGLGMGVAVGAPLLTLRSMFRVAASIVWVVGLGGIAHGRSALSRDHARDPRAHLTDRAGPDRRGVLCAGRGLHDGPSER